jgi:hypothetical protein
VREKLRMQEIGTRKTRVLGFKEEKERRQVVKNLRKINFRNQFDVRENVCKK